MRLTIKDLHIINSALAYFEMEMQHQEKGDVMWDLHQQEFGNPIKTLQATRERVFKEIEKKEVCVYEVQDRNDR